MAAVCSRRHQSARAASLAVDDCGSMPRTTAATRRRRRRSAPRHGDTRAPPPPGR
eukprot:CAMPEP_0198348802 /NCGR_PEP_ID=MMETSP1450-20131203/91369_1 /TAXON_ID=753684 ORGANISM="Madagascaria erythrocladiodes, Strain CCMP3234" /NCGR_SAMPLE_ID=MMETSP1450 /ASSEMBLY_ACC=CAM_ASM_001115 /LENGTH=54 /DNA_ID=CAMNT_0044054437 /DNA_START=60 /DNA_END=221 /DNA_ORIENTATION=-